MKRIILLLLLLIPFNGFSQNRKLDKLLDNYDVLPYIEAYKEQMPLAESFWYAVWTNNPRLKKMIDAAQKKKDTYVKAQQEMYQASLSAKLYRDQLNYITDYPFLDTLALNLLNDLNVQSQRPDFNIKFVYDDEPNASADPDANIVINSGILDNKKLDYYSLLGITAHESVHALLLHSLQNAWMTQVKFKENQVVGAITAGANAMANAYAQAMGVKVDWDDVNKTTADLATAAYDDAFNRYYYKYSREEELEADIIAYRFLDWIGVGGDSYISALKAIQPENEVASNKDNDGDHPTTEYRIQLLLYMAATRGRLQPEE
jgi:Zn-dependent protease with chaperone function